MFQTEKYARKPFIVDAVQVTEENIHDVASWCKGEVRENRLNADDAGKSLYVKVQVMRPLNERQTKAFVGDWVLYAGTGFKVYTGKAFDSTFERALESEYDRVFHNPEDKDLTLFQEAVSGSHKIVQIRETEGQYS